MWQSSCVHSFIWVIGAPKLTLHNVDEYINWLDNIVSGCLPDPKVDSTLYELVKTYQIHQHSKTCRRFKNDNCHFHFGRFFTDLSVFQIFQSIKTQFLYVQRKDYIELKSTEEILNMLDINVDVYYRSLEISDDNDFQIYFGWTPTSCFVNNYFKVGLEGWEANMDTQPVFNEKKSGKSTL